MLAQLRHEWVRRLRRSPVRLFLLLAYCGLAVWSAADGLAWKKSVTQAQAHAPPSHHVDRDAWTQELKAALSGEDDDPSKGRPMNLTLPAVLAPGPLSHLAHRGETIHPKTALISGWRNDASLFRRYEIEGPVPLSMMGMDLSAVLVVFFPLVLLLSTFDALSAERESGRLRLLMVQGLAVQDLLVARIFAIALPLWGITCVVALGASIYDSAAGSMTPISWSALALWLFAATAYACFWGASAMWIATRFRKSSDVALAALGVWVLVVLLVPAGVQFAAQALHPIPSRVEYLSKARTVEAKARGEIEKRAEVYMAEHEVEIGEGADKVPAYFRTYFLANEMINSKTAPMVEAQEGQRHSQARLANRLEFLAPSMLTSRLLTQFAGAGNERASEYRKQVREHLARLQQAIGPATVAKKRLSLEKAQAIADFRFVEAKHDWRVWLGLGWLLVVATALGRNALKRARAMRPGRET